MDDSILGGGSHPARMAARMARSLKRSKALLDADRQLAILAGALGHAGWRDWTEAYRLDADALCLGRFEQARVRLGALLAHAGVPGRAASRAAARAFAFEPNDDPRQVDLLRLLAHVGAGRA